MAYIAETVNAAATKRFNISGQFFALLTASANLAKVRFYRHNAIIEELETLGAGLRFEGKFDGVEFVAGAGATDIAFHVSDNKVEYDRGAASVDVLSIAGQQGAYTEAGVTVTNAVGGVLLKAANSVARCLIIQNQDAAGNLWLNKTGGAAIANNTCTKLAPGETLILDYPPTSAIYAISDAATCSVHVSEG